MFTSEEIGGNDINCLELDYSRNILVIIVYRTHTNSSQTSKSNSLFQEIKYILMHTKVTFMLLIFWNNCLMQQLDYMERQDYRIYQVPNKWRSDRFREKRSWPFFGFFSWNRFHKISSCTQILCEIVWYGKMVILVPCT